MEFLRPATGFSSRRIKIITVTALIVLAALVGALQGVVYARPAVDVDSAEVLYERDAGRKPGLRAVFFGTSTILLTDGMSSIMTDGFFSRPSWLRLMMSIKPDPEEINFALRKAPSKIDAIFVAHAHHDHAMDSGLVAQKTDAIVYGSESTLNIARGQSTPEHQLRVLKVGQTVLIGHFRVTAFETPHSPDAISPGFITHPVQFPAKLGEFRAAENHSFFVEHPLGKVLIVPSANYSVNAFEGLQADIVILGIGTLGRQSNVFTETYWNEVVTKTGAKLVLPVHWDDFTQSLRAPLVPLPLFADNMNVAMEWLGPLAKRDGVAIRFLPSLREVTLPAGN